MARFERFTFLCNADERNAIKRLAEKLQRSLSDAIRFLVITATKELEEKAKSSKIKLRTY